MIEQPCRAGKVEESEVCYFHAEIKGLVVHAGVEHEKIEFFVLRCEGGGLLERGECFFGLVVGNQRLCKKIVHGRSGVAAGV